jgi:hemolysin activation/secretion protein
LEQEEQRRIFEAIQKENSIERKELYTPKKLLIEEVEDKTCFITKQIVIEGSSLLSPSEQAALTGPYIGACNSLDAINNLVKIISNSYLDNGYITSKAYLKPQNLSPGKVIISVMEGRIEKFLAKNVNVENIFLGYTDYTLNIRDLEAGIEQLERLRSQRVTFKLSPGSLPGYSIVEIVGQKADPKWYGSIAVNNFGNDQSGPMQLSVSATYENLLNLNDIVSVSLNSSQHQDNKNDSFGNSFSYAFPLNRFYTTLSYAEFTYH